MDHASCLTCLTLSSSLRMLPTTYTGAPCNPSPPLQFPIISLSFISTPFLEAVALEMPHVDAFYVPLLILTILLAYLNIECEVVSATVELFCSVHPPVPLCRLQNTLIAFAPVLLFSCKVLRGITSAVTQTFSYDLNWPLGSYASNTDKPPAFVSVLPVASVCDPKDTQGDELVLDLPRPRSPGFHCLMHNAC